MEAKKSQAKKQVRRKPALVAVPKIETLEIADIQMANAVKVGLHQLLYLAAPLYEMTLKGEVIGIRHKSWGTKDKTVYTTLANVIFWRV